MAQHSFLKSIRPVNLLSFGPNTEEIELRPLNILIGPNGSGKSNLIEILGLLSKLPDKDPWSNVINTGGAGEWIWKGKNPETQSASMTVTTTKEKIGVSGVLLDPDTAEKKSLSYSISLRGIEGRFLVEDESFLELNDGEDDRSANAVAFDRSARRPPAPLGRGQRGTFGLGPNFYSGRPVLSLLGNEPFLAQCWPRMIEFARKVERFAFYRDWVFGVGSEIRAPQPAGLDSYRLERDSRNMAQVLKAWRDRGETTVFDRLVELLRAFYETVKDVDTELLGTHLRIMIRETTGFNTPATRLSDGTLRWLMLLIVLLDPAPPPVICIDEPELGLHPDAIRTIADLLVEASSRTQLIVTTHSTALVDAFTDDPESVCVCEKADGATRVRRLNKEQLSVWLKEYSLGHLWASGEIGGNRW